MLFDRKIEPCCSYCWYGTALGSDEIICINRGIMDAIGSCAQFRYEPTKRVPRLIPNLKTTGFTEEDFSL